MVPYLSGLCHGLPASEGNTTILTILDNFMEMVRFIPTDKLPSAKEPAELLLHHIIRLHGFPVDIVSDSNLSPNSGRLFVALWEPP